MKTVLKTFYVLCLIVVGIFYGNWLNNYDKQKNTGSTVEASIPAIYADYPTSIKCDWEVSEGALSAKLKQYHFKALAFRETIQLTEGERCTKQYCYDATKVIDGEEQDGLWDFRIKYTSVNGRLVVLSCYALINVGGQWKKQVLL